MKLRQVSQGNDVDIAIATLVGALRECPTSELLHVVLTGGSTGIKINARLYEVAGALHESIWNRVHLWWGDERFVAAESPLRNDYRIQESLGIFFSPDRVHQVASTDNCKSVSEAAHQYATELAKFGSPSPHFAITFLGVGPDGHVASLFPYSQQLHSNKVCVSVVDSPKPPSERISMTFKTLNRSERTLLFASGANKGMALRKLLSPIGSIDEIPARGVTAGILEVLA